MAGKGLRGRLGVAAALMFVMTLTGCLATDHAGTPAARAGAVLTISTRTLGGGAADVLSRLVSDVADGVLRVEVQTTSHRDLGARSDDAILADVASGDTDMGEVSIAALERAGVRSLSPITAPGLVTTINAQEALATSGWARVALAEVSSTGVLGMAVLPGPVQLLASVDPARADAASVRSSAFELVADSEAARAFVEALGLRLLVDDHADVLEPAAESIDLSPATVTTRSVAAPGSLYTDLPLWPAPTILVMNPAANARLDAGARGVLDEAFARLPGAVASLRLHDEAESLASLCRLGWSVTTADPPLSSTVVAAAAQVAAVMAGTPALEASMKTLTEVVSSRSTSRLLSCGEDNVVAERAGVLPDELLGAWEAEVTQDAIDAAEPGITEYGIVGRWRIEMADGRITITSSDDTTLRGALTVDGEYLVIDVDHASIEQGLGERWRFEWSVFHDRLALTSAPGDGMQRGPTSLVSQPFSQVG